MDKTESESIPVSEDELELIIDDLVNSDTFIPEVGIEAARKHPKEIIPLLIELVTKATRNCRQGLSVEDDGHFFATILLAEFRATEAWPALREAISLPDEKPFELYEDAITDDLGLIIASLIGDRLEEVDELIADSAINFLVRWEAINALLYKIRDGLLTRENVIERLDIHLQKAIENQDEIAEGIVLYLTYLGAESKLPLIELAFANQLVDPQMFTLDSAKKSTARGQEIFEESIARLRHLGDMIPRLHDWDSFRNAEDDEDDWYDELSVEPGVSYSDNFPLDSEYTSENDTTIRNEGAKIGRNEKCPCGSGMKYKKCCGRASNLDS